MAEVADSIPEPAKGKPPKKKARPWRAWLRAIHRDAGYLAVGFTIIYALSGIAMNHVDDWNYNYNASERALTIAPVPDEATDEEAAKLVADAAGYGAADDVFRAGDEVRLEYADGTKITAIGADVTVQEVKSRFFFRAAAWLHAAKGKQGWKYIADVYAVLLLYLAISGLFMIKGRLGLRWRGTILVAVGVAIPVAYLVWSGGPEGAKTPPQQDPVVGELRGAAPPDDREPRVG